MAETAVGGRHDVTGYGRYILRSGQVHNYQLLVQYNMNI